jgi:hypothetical protein
VIRDIFHCALRSFRTIFHGVQRSLCRVENWVPSDPSVQWKISPITNAILPFLFLVGFWSFVNEQNRFHSNPVFCSLSNDQTGFRSVISDSVRFWVLVQHIHQLNIVFWMPNYQSRKFLCHGSENNWFFSIKATHRIVNRLLNSQF